jgi:TPR repeat protein
VIVFFVTTPKSYASPGFGSGGGILEMCGKGDGLSCIMIGLSYYTGQTRPRDFSKAVNYLEKGCNAGKVAGCGIMADIFRQGVDGVQVDIERAVELDNYACSQGYQLSCERLSQRGVGQ